MPGGFELDLLQGITSLLSSFSFTHTPYIYIYTSSVDWDLSRFLHMVMVGLNSPSSSSLSTAPPKPSSFSSIDNGLFNSTSPPLPILESQRMLPHRPSLSLHAEKASGCCSIRSVAPNAPTAPKSSAELRKEIATLEAEIMLLERYLLSLYRIAFEESLSNSYNNAECKRETWIPTSADKSYNKLESHIQTAASPASAPSFSDDLNSSASLKLDSKKVPKFVGSGHRSLGDYLGASIMENKPDNLDRLSEQIIRCISSIYCKLGSAPQSRAGSSASPTSSLSSSSIFSSKNPSDSWSPRCYEDATVHNQGLKEDRYMHPTVVQVLKIYLDDDSFSYAADMLQKFRSLVRRLEQVDPRTMKREEKLAFWINIHNALVMHAYLAYGTANRVKTTSILKAAYNVGGHCVDAYIIQNSILGIRPHHSAPWLQTLFSPGRKPKAGNVRHVYALEYPEPLVHFALCSGAYSDPMVRAYRAKSIFEDLKQAKEEYIGGSMYIEQESKILMPKIVHYFVKDMSLDGTGTGTGRGSGVLELISGCVSETQRKAIRKSMKGRHIEKCISWVAQSSRFGYVIHRDLGQAWLD